MDVPTPSSTGYSGAWPGHPFAESVILLSYANRRVWSSEFKRSRRSGVNCSPDLKLAKECRGVLTQRCPGWKGAKFLKSVSPLGPSDCPTHCTLDKERSRLTNLLQLENSRRVRFPNARTPHNSAHKSGREQKGEGSRQHPRQCGMKQSVGVYAKGTPSVGGNERFDRDAKDWDRLWLMRQFSDEAKAPLRVEWGFANHDLATEG